MKPIACYFRLHDNIRGNDIETKTEINKRYGSYVQVDIKATYVCMLCGHKSTGGIWGYPQRTEEKQKPENGTFQAEEVRLEE